MENIDLSITGIYFIRHCILLICLVGKLRNKKAEVNKQKTAVSNMPGF